MGDVIESAAGILSQSARRVELSAQNIANISTAGYKRQTDFLTHMGAANSYNGTLSTASTVVDFAPGKEVTTDNPHDLAIAGEGFFVVRSPHGVLYTRQGQFQRAGDGRLLTAKGYALQAQGGGDLVLKTTDFKVTEDGAVLERGQAVAKLAIVSFKDPKSLTPADGGAFAAPDDEAVEVTAPSVRQGGFEASNVSTGDEMIAIMEALRRAEAAQRLVNVYDDLMGRALTSFGQ